MYSQMCLSSQVNELVDIYHQANFTDVTLESLKDCEILFDLGLWAEKVFGQVNLQKFTYFTALT